MYFGDIQILRLNRSLYLVVKTCVLKKILIAQLTTLKSTAALLVGLSVMRKVFCPCGHLPPPAAAECLKRG